MRIVSHSGLLLAVAFFWGCAEVPRQVDYHPGGSTDEEILWPEVPEVPRYRYAGQLVGEDNFVRSGSDKPGVGSRFVRWVVGLGGRRLRRPDNLLRPQSGMVGPNGSVYVTDAGRRAVFVFDMERAALEIWDRADRDEAFDAPVGIAMDEEGNFLVADAGLGRVVRLNATGRPIGSFGSGELGRPVGLVRRNGSIFVADAADHDVKVFDRTGRFERRIGRQGADAGEFNGPTHLALKNDNLYVSDTLNARIQVFDEQGQVARMVGSRGLYVGNLTRPKGVAVDSDGNVYVVESYYDHLVIFDERGRYLMPIGGTGAAIGNFFLPAGVWTDDRDRIFVADMYNGRVIVLQYLGE